MINDHGCLFPQADLTDSGVIGRFTRNMFQWNKNDIKSSQTTNGDYFYRSGRSISVKQTKPLGDLSDRLNNIAMCKLALITTIDHPVPCYLNSCEIISIILSNRYGSHERDSNLGPWRIAV